MLGGKHGILHAGYLGLTGQLLGVEQVGVEVVEVLVVLLLGNQLAGLNPLVTSGHGVQTEMDEHTEAIQSEPGGITGRLFGLIA